MTRRWWWALVLLIGVGLYSDLTWRKRKWERKLRDRVASVDHLVDIGVELRTVVQDPKGEELLPGKPRLRILRVRRAGGILDTQRGCLVAPSQRRTVWYCSEDQEPIILHADELPLGLEVQGSEGAGKTTILPKWVYFRWLEHLGERREGGFVAPTGKRMRMFLRELRTAYPAAWYRYTKSEELITFADGTRLQMVSAHQTSKDEGSPVQGYSWSFAAGDEAQDMLERHDDIEARGRAAKVVNGVVRYKQIRTETPKDDPAYRAYRDKLERSGAWQRVLMLGRRSPFIGASHWDRLMATMSKREYQRRVLAMDVGPERQLYHTWSHAESIRPIPADAVDVTAQELAPLGPNLTVLVGHDPGKLCHVSVFLKAFRARGWARTRWWVVGEVTTSEQVTIERHVREVLAYAGARWGCNLRDRYGQIIGPRIAVRADPYGDTGADENRPDITVYKVWKNHGVLIKPAAYVASAKTIQVQRVPKEARIDLTCTLLEDAAGERRLYVAPEPNGEVCAPRLVEALERMERDGLGRAETEAKNVKDLSHWPAALGYGLWAIEKPRIDALRRAAA